MKAMMFYWLKMKLRVDLWSARGGAQQGEHRGGHFSQYISRRPPPTLLCFCPSSLPASILVAFLPGSPRWRRVGRVWALLQRHVCEAVSRVGQRSCLCQVGQNLFRR